MSKETSSAVENESEILGAKLIKDETSLVASSISEQDLLLCLQQLLKNEESFSLETS